MAIHGARQTVEKNVSMETAEKMNLIWASRADRSCVLIAELSHGLPSRKIKTPSNRLLRRSLPLTRLQIRSELYYTP